MDKKTTIKEVAKEVFSEKGFKSTNISEIMKKAEMAVGTFYTYYGSKDELFMELYLEENDKLKRKIISAINRDDHPMHVMGMMLQLNASEMEKNPILREWFNRESFHKIEKNFLEKGGLESLDFMYSAFTEVVEYWQNKGVMRRDIKSDMIMAIFNALVQIEVQKDVIGVSYFPEIMNYMSQFIMNGLLES